MHRKFFPYFALLFSLILLQGCDRKKPLEIKKVKIDDIELAYYTRGSGDPLVMIMGFRGTMGIWDPALLENLEKNYTLIVFDNRGAGYSTDSKENVTTISQMAADTGHLIKALGYDKANVLGWSMGSRIALDLAINQPEIVDHLILCSPNAGGKHSAPRPTNAYGVLTTNHDLSLQEGLSIIFPNTSEGNDASKLFVIRLAKSILEKQSPEDLKVSDETVERQLRALKLWDEDNTIYDSLAKITSPALIMGGLEDALNNPENVGIVASQIPYAWTAYFSGAGHYFLSQDYLKSADLISVFIEATKKKPQSR